MRLFFPGGQSKGAPRDPIDFHGGCQLGHEMVLCSLRAAARIDAPTAVLREQDRRKTGLIYHKVSVCPGTQQTRICLCTMSRHDPFDDPGLYVDLVFERRALLFDLGDLRRLAPLMFLRVSDVFVTQWSVLRPEIRSHVLCRLAGITTGAPSPDIEFLAANSPLVCAECFAASRKAPMLQETVYVATQFRSRFSSAKSDAYKAHTLVRILFAQPGISSYRCVFVVSSLAGIVLKLPRVSYPASASVPTGDAKCLGAGRERPQGLSRPFSSRRMWSVSPGF
jgi:hypothetical protein